jgi:tetratricopeptide (TPR) repeat protein
LRSGPVVLDQRKRQLRLDRRPVPLGGLPLRILEVLMLAEGRVVTRAEFKQALWPYTERIDTERRLNTAIRALREVLGDTAAEPRLIRTVRGHGYRWIAGKEGRSARMPFGQLTAAAALALFAAAPAQRLQLPATNADAAAADRTFFTERSWRTAEMHYRAALQLQPSNLDAQRGLAWLYVNEGRTGAALPHIAALLQATDRSAHRQAQLGWLLLRAGKPEAALAACGAAGEQSLNLLSCRQTALARLGLVGEARKVGVDVMHLAGASPAVIAAVANAPARLGYARFLRWRIGAFVGSTGQWFQRAQLQAEAGMYREALASLQHAAASRDPLLAKIASSAEFGPLRRTPEYRRIAALVVPSDRLS